MMQSLLRIFWTVTICLAVMTGFGQRGLKKQAKNYFEAGKYFEALELYNQLKSNKENLLYKGIAAYKTGDVKQSLRALIDSYSQGNRDKRLFLYMANNYLAQSKYEDAAKFYKSYLQYLDHGSAERALIIHKIKRCGFAKDYKYVDQKAFVENLGENVNSIYDELSPLQSPGNPNKYYFSSNRLGSTGGLRSADGKKDDIYGSYSADMYAIESNNGNWTAVSSIDPVLNTPRHDIIQDFSKGGKILYYIKTDDLKSGTLLTDTFRSNREEVIFPKVMQCPIVSGLGDRDLRVFNDDTYIFSSLRAEGYGGYDLYIVTRDSGVWSEPINLGPEINSEFDELTPYLTNNGNKLFFSSNRMESMGGFDVYDSQFGLETGVWSTPNNLGVPINSPMDDVYFRLAGDGLTGVLSSNRIESLGGYDLFMVYFKNQEVDQMNLSYTVPFLMMRQIKMEEEAKESMAKINADEVEIDSTTESNTTDPIVENTDIEKQNEKNSIKDYTGIKTREVVIGPLYYEASENIINPQNLARLNKVIETLKIFPEAQVEITGHAIQEGLPEFDLYFSIKRAEKAADFIIQNGISKDRIFLRGAGVEYPTVSTRNPVQSSKYNRRIDLKIVYPDNVPLRIIYEKISVPSPSRDVAINKLRNFEKGLNYKITLANTKQMYKNPILRKERDVMIDKEPNSNTYQYTVGIYQKYTDARAAKSRITRDSQFSEISIEVYVNGRMISRSEVEKYLKIYSDLSNFMRYEMPKE